MPDVADEGPLTGRLPGLTPFLVPLNLETLRLILPTALSVAFVGLMETLLTAKLVDELTDTPSHKGRESWALGVANIARRLLRRHRRLRDDRPDRPQREDRRRAHPHLDRRRRASSCSRWSPG